MMRQNIIFNSLLNSYDIYDYDGNGYSTVIIDNQEWLGENLKTTHYANGSLISNITTNVDWAADTSGGYCWFDNSIGYKEPYGAMYNWYAVANASDLAYFERNGSQELGWRVPSKTDFETLSTALGGDSNIGKIKEAGLAHWVTPNEGAENYRNFNALPAGVRNANGEFVLLGYYNYLCSTTPDVSLSWRLILRNDILAGEIGSGEKVLGASVRCVRDI